MLASKIYYQIKPAIPRPVQLAIRQYVVGLQLKRNASIWPIDPTSGQKPEGWPGWPDGKKFALILTHDVDTSSGQKKCLQLKDLESNYGLRSCFNFVPERYPLSAEVIEDLRSCGFEIGVHGLNHDGKLYVSRDVFTARAIKINHYLKAWGAVGFRSPAMHHQLDWIHDLDIKYDSSTFDTDPFEPQSDGVGTIFPFYVESNDGSSGYFELPYTLPQDFTIFVLMKNRDINVWKKKLDWIVSKGGMALINTHPDYMRFSSQETSRETYPHEMYQDFLTYVVDRYDGDCCNLLPSEVVSFLSCH